MIGRWAGRSFSVPLLAGGIFALVGSMFLITSIVLFFQGTAFADRAVGATGQVVDLIPSWSRDNGRRGSATYASLIRFRDRRGQTIEFLDSVSSRPPRHERGEKVAILYDPAHPSSAVIDDVSGRYGISLIMGPLGLVFTVLGLTFLYFVRRQRVHEARLRKHGRTISADFLHVYIDRDQRVNGRHPFRIVAQASDPATGMLRRYESQPVWVDPTAQLTGKTLKVLVDPNDPDRHLVDLTGVVDPRERM